MRTFWPPREAAQADYEALRSAVIEGVTAIEPVARRFARARLAALITRPVCEPVFVAVLRGARRPIWSPYDDPRLAALAASYALVLTAEHDERKEAAP